MNFDRLVDILSYMRPGGSKAEEEMIAKWIDPVPGMQQDSYGNRYVVIGNTVPRTMFACHTDTVHRVEGKQELMDDYGWRHLFPDSKQSNCLGADDGAGIEVLLSMIDAEVPGLYVFHRDEESGGRGADAFLAAVLPVFPTIRYCISFDRKGTKDVITHQAGGRCCSDAFAEALAKGLNEHAAEMEFAPNCGGIFTDSAVYTDDIEECTNISVGYYNEHTKDEYLDYGFLELLIDAAVGLDWDNLPVIRQAGEDDFDWGNHWDEPVSRMRSTQYYAGYPLNTTWEIEQFVYERPEEAVELIYKLLYEEGM